MCGPEATVADLLCTDASDDAIEDVLNTLPAIDVTMFAELFALSLTITVLLLLETHACCVSVDCTL